MIQRKILFVVVLALFSLFLTRTTFFWSDTHQQQRSGELTRRQPLIVTRMVHNTTRHNNGKDDDEWKSNNNVVFTAATNRTNASLLSSLVVVHYQNNHSLLKSASTPLPLCSHEQVMDGEWQPTVLPNGPPFQVAMSKRCYNQSYLDQRPFPTWEWVPRDSAIPHARNNACEWTPWNATLFCELLPAATVLILGDSLSREHCLSLTRLLGSNRTEVERSPISRPNLFADNVCDNQTRILFQLDRYLNNLTNSLLQHTPPATVVIMNRGAHYTNDTTLLTELRRSLHVIQVWWRQCQQYQLHCHFFYRTTVPGHPQCHQFTAPVNNLTYMEAWIAKKSHYNLRNIDYHWYDFKRQNQLILKELERHSVPFILLDAYHVNILRPDGHQVNYFNDCLHNCPPGKTEVFNQLLLHELRRHRTRQQAEHDRLVLQNYTK